jgi:hypothetical protein
MLHVIDAMDKEAPVRLTAPQSYSLFSLSAVLVVNYMYRKGAIGLDGGYEAHVACRGSITT